MDPVPDYSGGGDWMLLYIYDVQNDESKCCSNEDNSGALKIVVGFIGEKRVLSNEAPFLLYLPYGSEI